MSTMSELHRQLAEEDPDLHRDEFLIQEAERRAKEAALLDQRDIAEAQAEAHYEELQGEKYLEQIKDADTVVEPTELF